MAEVSLEGERYTGVFNGDKREINSIVTSYHEEWYEGAGLIQHRPDDTKYFFKFLIPQKFSKSSLKESLESLCVHSKGFDSLCESVTLKVILNSEKEQIPEIDLSIR